MMINTHYTAKIIRVILAEDNSKDYYYIDDEKIVIPKSDKSMMNHIIHQINKCNEKEKRQLRIVYNNQPQDFVEAYNAVVNNMMNRNDIKKELKERLKVLSRS